MCRVVTPPGVLCFPEATVTYKAWKKEVDRLFSEREESLESYSFDWHKAHEYGL